MSEESSNKDIFIDFVSQHINIYNTWRISHPNEYDEATNKWSNPVDFSGVNFKEFAKDNIIRFSQWNFGSDADFSNANFEGCQIIFENCDFGENLNFSELKLGESLNFNNCTFFGKLEFKNYTIKNLSIVNCRLVDASNEPSIIFEKCIFEGEQVSFHGTEFQKAIFKENQFQSKDIIFSSTRFFRECYFEDCNFLNELNFQESLFDFKSSFTNCIFKKDIDFKLGRNTIALLPSFISCEFYGELKCGRRSLNADFSGSIFLELPDFSTKDIDINKLNLTEVKFQFVNKSKSKWPYDFTFDSSVLLKLRALRGVAEATKNHDLERDLYIEERKAERGIYLNEYGKKLFYGNITSRLFNLGRFIDHFIMIIIMRFYWISSNYGRNIILPLIWYVTFLYFQLFEYRTIFNEVSLNGIRKGSLNGEVEIEKFNTLVDTLAIANNIPIIGNLSLDNEMKQFVFCGGQLLDKSSVCIPPDGYLWIVISQNLISGILIFLFGLGLRNYFKIK